MSQTRPGPSDPRRASIMAGRRAKRADLLALRMVLAQADGAVVQPDALIVPLVGFDEACHRLGYGGGYYDRTLAKANAKPLTIGIGFEFMRLASIEPLAHDIPMDFIVTEAGVFPRSRLTA
jgi:5,10-methenyltetrahydrofolate synthetase